MQEVVEVPYFSETDIIINIEDFTNLIQVSLYWGQEEKFIPASIYVYYLLHENECMAKLANIFLEKENLNYDLISEYYNEYDKLDADAKEHIIFTKGDQYKGILKDLFLYFAIEGIIDNEYDVFNFIKSCSHYYPYTEPLKQIIIDLSHFSKIYQNRKEYINDLPLVPLKSHILNKNYFDRYVLTVNLKARKNPYFPVIINVQINSVYIDTVEIVDFKFLLAMINNLKTDNEDEPKGFNIGIKNNNIKYDHGSCDYRIKIGRVWIYEPEIEINDDENYFFNNILNELIKIRDFLLKTRSELNSYVGKEDKYYLENDDLIYNE